MATPIQYTPQFIPTNVGLMNNILAQKQSDYDAGYAAPGMFEDKFAQIQVSPENMAGKQAILGNFQDKIKGVVDRYGGDYGAASKDIVREIARERQNPFYQMAPQHQKALARQQSMKDKLGSNYFALNEVPSKFVDETGRVNQNVELNPNILNQQDLEKTLLTEFGGLGKQVREGGLKNIQDRPGMLESATTRGITQNEVSGVADQMLQRLRDSNPDLAAAIDAGDPRAMQIAQNMANQMVGGTTRRFMRDPSYVAPKPGEKGTSGMKNYITRVGKATSSWETPEEMQKDLDQYNKKAQFYEETLALRKEGYPEKQEDFFSWLDESKENKKFLNRKVASDYLIQKRLAEKMVDKAAEPFKGAMLDDLMNNYGLSQPEAINAVIKERSMNPVEHPVAVRTTSERSKDAMLDAINLGVRDLDFDSVDIYKDGTKKTKSKESKETDVKNAIYDGNIIDLEVDLKNGDIILHDKNGESYGIPARSLSDFKVSENINGYKEIINTLYGESSGRLDTPVIIGDDRYGAIKQFNPESGIYESEIYLLNDYNDPIQVVPEESFNEMFFTQLFSTYGTQPQYKPTNINK